MSFSESSSIINEHDCDPPNRAHSAPSVAIMGTRNQGSRSSQAAQYQAMRTLRNGLAATVPHSLLAYDINCSHRPNRRYTRRQSTLQQHKENMELRCCRINVLLVTMQTFLGITITALGFYMRTLTLSLQYYECPFWAGIPLSLTGTIGMYLCATDFKAYTGSTKMMVVKAVCFTLSAICMFVAIVAAVFVGIHGHRIASYDECKWYNNSKNTSTCECTIDKLDPDARIYIYEGVRRCNLIFSSIKDYLILECALTSVASGVSVWFVILLWKSRYQKFSGSLRLYSYSGGQTSHPVGQNPCASLNASNAEDPERRHSSFQVQGALQKRLLEECRQKEREQFGYSHNSEET